MNRRQFGSAVGGLLASGAEASAQASSPLMKVRISSSLVAGTSDSQLVSVTKPVAEIVAVRTGCLLDFDVARIDRPLELKALGRALSRGQVHFAAIWGLEFGWLSREFPNIRPNCVASREESATRSVIYTRKDSAPDLEALRGKVIARHKRSSLMDVLYVRSQVRAIGADPGTFFRPSPKVYSTAKEAAQAVKSGDVDCAATDPTIFDNLAISNENLMKSLAIVARTETYPQPAMVGVPGVINAIRPGLWEMVQARLQEIGKDVEGEQLLQFWRVRRFIKPDQGFQEQVKAAIARFPAEVYEREITEASGPKPRP